MLVKDPAKRLGSGPTGAAEIKVRVAAGVERVFAEAGAAVAVRVVSWRFERVKGASVVRRVLLR